MQSQYDSKVIELDKAKSELNTTIKSKDAEILQLQIKQQNTEAFLQKNNIQIPVDQE